MSKGVRILPFAALALLASCASIRNPDSPMTATASVNYASQYWFRGVPQNEAGNLQGSMGVAVPTSNGGTINASAWGNMLLSNDSGDAVMADQNGGEFGEIDLTGSYSQQFGQFAVTTGVVSYNFPNAIGPSTHELFVAAATEWFTLKHTLTLYYDFDLLDDMYLNYMAAKSWGIAEGTNFDLSGMIGYMGADQAEFYFGTDDSGLSDASITAGVSHTWDANTTLFLSGTLVTVIDSDLEDASDNNNFETDGAWITAGVAWSL